MMRALPLLALTCCVAQHATVDVTRTGDAAELELYVISDATCEALLAAPELVVESTVWNYERFGVDGRPTLSVRPPEGRYLIFVSALAADGVTFVGHGCVSDVRFARGATTRIDIRLR